MALGIIVDIGQLGNINVKSVVAYYLHVSCAHVIIATRTRLVVCMLLFLHLDIRSRKIIQYLHVEISFTEVDCKVVDKTGEL